MSGAAPSLLAPSLGPSALAGLSAEQQQRLSSLLDRYLLALEQGTPLDVSALAVEHPDLAEVLHPYLRSLADLHDLAAGLGDAKRSSQGWIESAAGPRRLGDFELLRELGRGGMGVVYEARQLSLDRLVAIKLLPLAAVLDSRQIARFRHEAQAAAQLHHPHIVPVFAIGEESGIHYYAMQLIPGQPLDRIISAVRGGPALGRRQWQEHIRAAIELAIQAADALQSAHEAGIVHRDIKPSNLLRDDAGKLWVADFGLARFQPHAALTRTGDLVGTMRYMSPEQAAGRAGLVDARTDVYALGATLYELVCLRPVFADDEGTALLRRIETDEPTPPRLARRGIPRDLETVILKALSKRPDERYASARQLADDLRRVRDGQPTLARPASPTERLARWTWRHRRAAAAAMLAIFLALAGVSFALGLVAREKQRADENLVRAERNSREARRMLDHFGVDLAQRLAEVPGAAAVRQELLAETRAYYDRFAAQASRDPALRGDLALAQAKIAALLGEGGQTAEALAAHRQAARLFAELVAAKPDQPALQGQLAQCENNLGLAWAQAGNAGEARQHFAAAIDRQRRLVAAYPANADWPADLASSLANLGLIEWNAGQVAAARGHLQEAVELLADDSAGQPADPLRARKLAAAMGNLAATYKADEPARAVALFERVLVLQRAAAEGAPGDWPWHREVALTMNNLGSALARVGEPAEARACHEQAIRLQEELVRLAPSLPAYRRDLAISLNNRGLLDRELRDAAAAEAAFDEALSLGESLLTEQPGDFALASSVGCVLHNRAMLDEQHGRLAEAAERFGRAVEYQARAAAGAPETAQYAEFLRQHRAGQQRAKAALAASQRAATSEEEQ
ncbi:MAG: serine/threonine-protein kinase [Pirellulaceae bacterium]|nr:serine/threonine-protein kinase [Pirellulaceae bacterium]